MMILKTKPKELSLYIHRCCDFSYYSGLFIMAGLGELWGYIIPKGKDEFLKEQAFIKEYIKEKEKIQRAEKVSSRKSVLNIKEVDIRNCGRFAALGSEIELNVEKGNLSDLRQGIVFLDGGEQDMTKSKVTLTNVSAKRVGEVVSSAHSVEVNIDGGSYEDIDKMVHLYLNEEGDTELEAAFESAPKHIKEEFYKEMASTSKDGWLDKIKELKLSAYLSSVEKIADVSTKLYNLWDKIKDINIS